MTLGGEHTMKGTDDVSQNFTLETDVIWLTTVTPTHLM